MLPEVIRGMSGLLCLDEAGELGSSAGKCLRFRKPAYSALAQTSPSQWAFRQSLVS